MTDLTTRLRAQLDEDQRVALAAGGVAWTSENDPYDGGSVEVANPAPGEFGIIVYAEGRPSSEQANHIAAWDPARVLAEVQAKRDILDLHQGAHQCTISDPLGDDTGRDRFAYVLENEDCTTVHLIAQLYAGLDGR